MKTRTLLLTPVVLLCLLAAPFAQGGEPGAGERGIQTIILETTPAFGNIDEMATDRVMLLPASGEIRVGRVLAKNGTLLEEEILQVDPARLEALAQDVLASLLTPPEPPGGMALDGWYAYLTLSFEGDYSMRLGGHMADELGPQGFVDACAAIRALVDGAKAP